jgi:hypothetical protein
MKPILQHVMIVPIKFLIKKKAFENVDKKE